MEKDQAMEKDGGLKEKRNKKCNTNKTHSSLHIV